MEFTAQSQSESRSRMTIGDVAKRAGVSKATVSRVLNNKPDVDETTRQRVLNVIDETNYNRSVVAAGLARGRRNLLGLLAPSLSGPYSLGVIQGVAEALDKTDYELVLFTTGLDAKNEERFAQVLGQDLTDGMIILLPRSAPEYLERLRSSPSPVVLIDYHGVPTGLPTVTASNRLGAYHATQYLLALGHTRIGFITGLLDLGAGRDRLAGYQDALAEAKLAPCEELICEGNFTKASGYDAARALLDLSEPPSAIFASNDDMALGALEAIRARGLSAPGDISVVGFDDIPAAAYALPPLTTIQQPLRSMGIRAVEMLLQQVLRPTAEVEDVEVATKLVVRDSCIRHKVQVCREEVTAIKRTATDYSATLIR